MVRSERDEGYNVIVNDVPEWASDNLTMPVQMPENETEFSHSEQRAALTATVFGSAINLSFSRAAKMIVENVEKYDRQGKGKND